MSYVFDKTSSVYREHILPHVPDKELGMLFEMVLEEIHLANHRVPSSDGVFKGDGLNHDRSLRSTVQQMVDYLEGRTNGSR